MERKVETNSTVTSDIGGTIYRVSRTNLMRFPDTMLYVSASKRWNKADCTVDAIIYIDRNGERFQYILDYMRDNEVNLPYSVPKEALINDFKFYGFCVDNILFKAHFVHPSDREEHKRCWMLRHYCKSIDLTNDRSILICKVEELDLEIKYTDFCYELFNRHLETGEITWVFQKEDFDKYGGFYTHDSADSLGFDSSNRPHPVYLDNKVLRKCALYFQISDIYAYTFVNDKGVKQYKVKIGMIDTKLDLKKNCRYQSKRKSQI